jgi:hypothetical protein
MTFKVMKNIPFNAALFDNPLTGPRGPERIPVHINSIVLTDEQLKELAAKIAENNTKPKELK